MAAPPALTTPYTPTNAALIAAAPLPSGIGPTYLYIGAVQPGGLWIGAVQPAVVAATTSKPIAAWARQRSRRMTPVGGVR